MSDTVIATILIIAIFFGLPVCILLFRDRISTALWNRRNPPEKLAADRRTHEERILHPDWDFYERHLQRPAPPALRALYADRTLVTTRGLDFVNDEGFEDTISTFEPLDEQGLVETRPWLGFDVIAISLAASEGVLESSHGSRALYPE